MSARARALALKFHRMKGIASTQVVQADMPISELNHDVTSPRDQMLRVQVQRCYGRMDLAGSILWHVRPRDYVALRKRHCELPLLDIERILEPDLGPLRSVGKTARQPVVRPFVR